MQTMRAVARWRNRPENKQRVARRLRSLLLGLSRQYPAFATMHDELGNFTVDETGDIFTLGERLDQISTTVSNGQPLLNWTYYAASENQDQSVQLRLTAEGPRAYKIPLASVLVVQISAALLSTDDALGLAQLLVASWEPDAIEIAHSAGSEPVMRITYGLTHPAPDGSRAFGVGWIVEAP